MSDIINLAKEYPQIAIFVISIISLAILVVAVYFIFTKYIKIDCLSCEVIKDRDFYKKLAEHQNSDVKFLVDSNKEIRNDLTEQKEINKKITKALDEINVNMRLNNQILKQLFDMQIKK